VQGCGRGVTGDYEHGSNQHHREQNERGHEAGGTLPNPSDEHRSDDATCGASHADEGYDPNGHTSIADT
jgi:hypothetical protein